jgi:hypothetical protein
MAIESLFDIHRRAHLVHSQMESARDLLARTGQADPNIILSEDSPYFSLLKKLYEEEYPLAKLVGSSDLIIHAEGPAAEELLPQLSIVSWLFSGVDKQIRALAKSVLHLSLDDERGALKSLDIRLTGMAPGSIYAGFAINRLRPTPLLGTDEEETAINSVRDVVTSLALIPDFVLESSVSEALAILMPDPAIRDTTLMAAYNLAPTGRNGIHTIELTSPAHSNKPAPLSVRDRIVLRDTVVKRPMLGAKKKSGSFIGQLRGIDLDKTRVDLRNVDGGIGTLRCVLPLTLDKARSILGKTVRVTGQYEAGPNGKPRLMQVEQIDVIENRNLDF